MKILVCRHGGRYYRMEKMRLEQSVPLLADRLREHVEQPCLVVSQDGWQNEQTAGILAEEFGGEARVDEYTGLVNYHKPSKMLDCMVEEAKQWGTLIVVTSQPAMQDLPWMFRVRFRVPVHDKIGKDYLDAMILDTKRGVFKV